MDILRGCRVNLPRWPHGALANPCHESKRLGRKKRELDGACSSLSVLQGLGYPPMPAVPEPAPAAEPASSPSAGSAHDAQFMLSKMYTWMRWLHQSLLKLRDCAGVPLQSVPHMIPQNRTASTSVPLQSLPPSPRLRQARLCHLPRLSLCPSPSSPWPVSNSPLPLASFNYALVGPHLWVASSIQNTIFYSVAF